MNPKQRTDEWKKIRAGKITCSRMEDVLRMSRAYLAEVQAGLRGEIPEDVDSAALRWGRKHEPMAIAAYELKRDADVRLSGFIHHPDIDHVGGSPDGLVDPDGVVEAKCPFDQTVHLVTTKVGVPLAHQAQIQGLLWVTGRKWCDFVSFDPRAKQELYVERVHRDELYIRRLEKACARFWGMVLGAKSEKSIPALF